MALYAIEKVVDNQSAFQQKVISIAKELAVNPDSLMIVMWNESGLKPDAENGSGCVGLIQFCPDYGQTVYKTIGGKQVDLSSLKTMSNIDQLDYVRDYFAPYAGRLNGVEDLYMVGFFPAALGWSDDKVLETSQLPASTVAQNNPTIDVNKDGQITVGEFKQWVRSKIPSDYVPNPVAEPTKIQKYVAYVEQPTNWLKIVIVIAALIILFFLLLKILKKI